MQQVGDDNLIREGIEALRQGRAGDARLRFERLTSASPANPDGWLLLAICRRTEGDPAAEETALDRLLQLDPQSIRGLIMKGDCRAAARDDANAIGCYRAAIGLASTGATPPDVAPEVERARQAVGQLQDRAFDKRARVLEARGLPASDWSPRFRHALDLAAGRRTLYFQQPTVFNFPGLPHVQFYDPADFPWAPAIEAATADVRDELVALLGSDAIRDFRPYIQGDGGAVRLDRNRALVENKDWSALFLVENGKINEALTERCPKTWQALQAAPTPAIPGWGPTAMFSLLKGGARIAAHNGMFNTRLVCHLPLIVPPNCRFRVGDEVREWREGKLLIFDDTIEHEAWNDSSEDRVVLIFDVWRPELSEREQRELTALLTGG